MPHIVTRYVSTRYTEGYEAVTAGGTVTSASSSISITSGTTLGAQRTVIGACAGRIDATGFQGSTSWTNANLGSLGLFVWANTDVGSGGGVSVGNGRLASAGAGGTFASSWASATTQAFCSLAIIGDGANYIEVYDQTTAAGTNNVSPSTPTYGGNFGLWLFCESTGPLETPSGGWTEVYSNGISGNGPWLSIYYADADTVTDNTPTLTFASTGATGTASITLGALTTTATGTTPNLGQASLTIGLVASSATGTVLVEGSGSIGLGALSTTAAGTVLIQGTGGGTLGAIAVTATGTVGGGGTTGAANITLGALTATSTGTVLVEGSGAGSISLSATATGEVDIEGSGSGTVSLSTTATGTVALSGSGGGTISLSVTATGVGELDDIEGSGSGTVSVTVTASGLGGTINGSASLTLGAIWSARPIVRLPSLPPLKRLKRTRFSF